MGDQSPQLRHVCFMMLKAYGAAVASEACRCAGPHLALTRKSVILISATTPVEP